jgi:4-hydroxy-3-polyprenylbenzoate decarboxylase
MENQQFGEDVDLGLFPTSLWHSLDGGRYIGTGSVTITHSLHEDWVNLGTYRIMVVDRNTISFFVSPGKHAKLHLKSTLEQKRPALWRFL